MDWRSSSSSSYGNTEYRGIVREVHLSYVLLHLLLRNTTSTVDEGCQDANGRRLLAASPLSAGTVFKHLFFIQLFLRHCRSSIINQDHDHPAIDSTVGALTNIAHQLRRRNWLRWLNICWILCVWSFAATLRRWFFSGIRRFWKSFYVHTTYLSSNPSNPDLSKKGRFTEGVCKRFERVMPLIAICRPSHSSESIRQYPAVSDIRHRSVMLMFDLL